MNNQLDIPQLQLIKMRRIVPIVVSTDIITNINVHLLTQHQMQLTSIVAWLQHQMFQIHVVGAARRNQLGRMTIYYGAAREQALGPFPPRNSLRQIFCRIDKCVSHHFLENWLCVTGICTKINTQLMLILARYIQRINGESSGRNHSPINYKNKIQ